MSGSPRSHQGLLQSDSGSSPSYRKRLDLLRGAQKGSRGAPAYSRFINRPLGRRFAAAASMAGLTPNGVTAISAAFSFAGIAVLATLPASVWTGVLVAVLLVMGYALDSADGQLARLQGGGSIAGEWLDHVVDSAKVVTLHLAVLVSFYRVEDLAPAWLLIPLGFTVVAVVSFFTAILNDQLRRHTGARERSAAGQSSHPLRSLMVLPTDYGLLCVSFILLGFHQIFVYAYAAMAAFSALYLALALPKWFREMRSLAQPGSSS